MKFKESEFKRKTIMCALEQASHANERCAMPHRDVIMFEIYITTCVVRFLTNILLLKYFGKCPSPRIAKIALFCVPASLGFGILFPNPLAGFCEDLEWFTVLLPPPVPAVVVIWLLPSLDCFPVSGLSEDDGLQLLETRRKHI